MSAPHYLDEADLRYLLEERAAILEHDAHMPRVRAEVRARAEVEELRRRGAPWT